MGLRVIQAKAFGGPEVLTPVEVEDPVAGPGQVVVAVAYADTLNLDIQLRRGVNGEFFKVEPPYVPGGGVAGTVTAAGAGVDPGWVGRRVTARLGVSGAYAQQAVAQVDNLVPIPDGLGLREAAALIFDGVTGLGLAELAAVRPREWVLVTAAGGGLGTLLVQLATAAGGRVVAAARGTRKLEVARKLGAAAVVDYTGPGWTDQVRSVTGGAGAAVVFDGAGGSVGQEAFTVTASGRRLFNYGAPSGGFAQIDPDAARDRGITVRGITALQFGPADVRRLTELALAEAAAGRLHPVIGQTCLLEEAAAAHAAMEAREVIGKTLLVNG